MHGKVGEIRMIGRREYNWQVLRFDKLTVLSATEGAMAMRRRRLSRRDPSRTVGSILVCNNSSCLGVYPHPGRRCWR